MAPKNQRDLSGYRYSALSSLVLSAGHRQDQNEPTGEAESLVGRIDPKSMGSRVVKSCLLYTSDAADDLLTV